MGKFAVEVISDDASSFVKIPSPGIVTKALPAFQYLFFRGVGKMLDGGVGINEMFVVGSSLFDSGLLKNDF